MVIVVDSSVAASWFLNDESDPAADAAFSRLMKDSGIVPHLWHAEVRNALLVAERRRRISSLQAYQRLEALGQLPIDTDVEPDMEAAMDLARAHGLSFYDALYLELAKRLAAPLATLDAALARAAFAEGLEVATP